MHTCCFLCFFSAMLLVVMLKTLNYDFSFFQYQMMKVRKMLTEILLDVTNSELKSVCKEVLLKEKSRAAKGRNTRGRKCTYMYFMWYFDKDEKTCFGLNATSLCLCPKFQWLNTIYVCLYSSVVHSNTAKTWNQKIVAISTPMCLDLILKMLILPLLILGFDINKYIESQVQYTYSHICTIYIWARRKLS